MTVRTFVARDGAAWSVRRIQSTEDGVPGTPREWLAFQDAAGTQRRRLFEIPPDWSELPDDRLHLLCRMAEPVTLGWQ